MAVGGVIIADSCTFQTAVSGKQNLNDTIATEEN